MYFFKIGQGETEIMWYVSISFKKKKYKIKNGYMVYNLKNAICSKTFPFPEHQWTGIFWNDYSGADG